MKSLYKEVLLISELSSLINSFNQSYGEVKMEFLKGNHVQLKIIDNKGKSIGYLFSFIERMKKIYSIKDYSAQ